jgi:hypothetical protein
MAVTISKTYSVTVTFRYIDGRAIADSDLNVSELRTEIKKKIGSVSNVQKGDINAIPGTVSES